MLKAYRMKGSGYCIFYVAQQGIHPFEGWVFNPFTPTFGDERNRMAPCLFHCFETSQAIADQLPTSRLIFA